MNPFEPINLSIVRFVCNSKNRKNVETTNCIISCLTSGSNNHWTADMDPGLRTTERCLFLDGHLNHKHTLPWKTSINRTSTKFSHISTQFCQVQPNFGDLASGFNHGRHRLGPTAIDTASCTLVKIAPGDRSSRIMVLGINRRRLWNMWNHRTIPQENHQFDSWDI